MVLVDLKNAYLTNAGVSIQRAAAVIIATQSSERSRSVWWAAETGVLRHCPAELSSAMFKVK